MEKAGDEWAYGQRMPKYKCFKEVRALKIKSVTTSEHRRAVLEFEEPGFEPLEVSAGYVVRHDPKPGGYYVVYGDGYRSWSPGKAFEEGYTRIEA